MTMNTHKMNHVHTSGNRLDRPTSSSRATSTAGVPDLGLDLGFGLDLGLWLDVGIVPSPKGEGESPT